MNNLIEYIPIYERKSKVYNELIKAYEEELYKKHLYLDDILNQVNVDTATWGLDIYEKELNIKKDISKSYEERRSLIKSKLRGIGKVDKALIKLVADSYTNGHVDVKFDNNIKIKFNSLYGIPSNLDDLKTAINEIKPAHLRILYEFSYLLIEDIHDSMTINELQNKQLNLFAGGDEYVE